MRYNDREKRTTKTVEINSIELQKCRTGKRFKVDVITKHRDGGGPIRPTLRELVEQLVVDVSSLKIDMSSVKADIADMKTTLNEHSKRLDKQDEFNKKIINILERNNIR